MLHLAGAHSLWVRPHFQMDFSEAWANPSEGFFREKRANECILTGKHSCETWKRWYLKKNPRHFNMKMKTPVKNKSVGFDIF